MGKNGKIWPAEAKLHFLDMTQLTFCWCLCVHRSGIGVLRVGAQARGVSSQAQVVYLRATGQSQLLWVWRETWEPHFEIVSLGNERLKLPNLKKSLVFSKTPSGVLGRTNAPLTPCFCERLHSTQWKSIVNCLSKEEILNQIRSAFLEVLQSLCLFQTKTHTKASCNARSSLLLPIDTDTP